ncbi:glycosyltransferase [Leptolyngbya sp. GB1-A1]|uniref:glycosyltransferase n=1 Tax=Leptolyngbya sp. GB1-A1 TaxID=2933908 RepID=UPI00329A072A
MPYVVVQNFFSSDTVINGGSQSARNLLVGLHHLGCPLHILSWNTGTSGTTAIKWVNCEFGKIAAVSLPPLQAWHDPVVVSQIRTILHQLPEQDGIFHLLEPKEYLGSWLSALEKTSYQVIATALDYAWICATSHLLTRQSAQCAGPKNASSCLQCFYDHRHLLKALALKLMLASTSLPAAVTKSLPNQLTQLAHPAQEKRIMTETRLAALEQDFQRVDALIAPSKVLGQFFIENGLAKHKVHHIPYGTQAGTKLTLDDRPPLSEKIVFGFVGKLTFDKGLDLLIEALKQLRQQEPNPFRLIVYASPHPSGFGQIMQQQIASLDWITLSQFDGRDPSSIDAAHRSIHFQIAPSRWTDNLPNAVLEGVERQTPIIAPDYGSFPEMIQHGVNGWLYSNNTVATLKETLSNLIRTPKSYAKLSFDAATIRRPIDEATDVFQLYRTLNQIHKKP